MAGQVYPTISEILQYGWPPEWIPFLVISGILLVAIIILDIYVVYQHKKFTTKFPLQCSSSLGVLQVFPFFAIMHTVALYVPKCTEVSTYLAEAYEAITFLFFLRLVLTYLGGKKATKKVLKGKEVHLNVIPCCCFFCLPKVKFTKKYFVFCEWLIMAYVIFCLGVGFVQLITVLDESDTYPTSEIEGTFAITFHIASLCFLVLSIYGLSGIYHSCEEHLAHRGIVKKFLVYKIFVSIAKVEEILCGSLSHHGVIGDEFNYKEHFPAGLRARMWASLMIVVEAAVMFPLAVKIYDIKDYDISRPEREVNEEEAQENVILNVLGIDNKDI